MLSTVTESPQEEVRGCECVCVWLGGGGGGGRRNVHWPNEA